MDSLPLLGSRRHAAISRGLVQTQRLRLPRLWNERQRYQSADEKGGGIAPSRT
ncbi:hypothetical protein SEA_ARCANINE_57 [Mycobacterium phage Arcanine]|nr:hypothetical protein SEA_ARCANINE_57 [Mycobacterium phage Arcanine]